MTAGDGATPPRKIVIGYDRSIDARAAAAWALDEAARTGALAEFFHAREPAGSELSSTVQGMLDDANALGRRIRPAVRTAISIAKGAAAPALIERSSAASLIVLGSVGHSSVAGRLGSVSVAVSAHAHCPVVVVRGTAAATAPIVVGFDESEPAWSALAFAAEQAATRHVPLRIIHARRTGRAPAVTAGDLVAACRLDHPDLEISAETVAGRSAAALVRAAADAQLVAVGSRGRSALRGMLLGSVSQRLLRDSACPVAVVHSRVTPPRRSSPGDGRATAPAAGPPTR
jgi:nucleotide-binding universal stress UspA family protein